MHENLETYFEIYCDHFVSNYILNFHRQLSTSFYGPLNGSTTSNNLNSANSTPQQENFSGGNRLSQVLPDINWNPDPYKYGKNANVKCESLEIRYPLTFRAMDYMVQHDFELPKLNTKQRRSFFRYPSEEEKTLILQKFPNFKSGRFISKEKDSLKLKLKEYWENIDFSHDEQRSFIKEMENFPSCPGVSRGSSSHNLAYVKLYFACHVAGRKFLQYRLAFDLYNTIISLWKTELHTATNPDQRGQENATTDPKLNETTDDEVKGRYKTEDSCELIRSVISHLHSRGLPIEADEMNLTDIEWKQIQKETFRTPTSMYRHFSLVILPLLKGATNEEMWQEDLLQRLLEKKINYMQDIDWKELQKNYFPNQSNLQLRTFVSNQVHKRLRSIGESGEQKPPVYNILNAVYQRLLDLKSRTRPSSCAKGKEKEIINCYENFKESLSVYSNREVIPRQNDGICENAVKNDNSSQKRKGSDVLSGSKRRKKSHLPLSQQGAESSSGSDDMSSDDTDLMPDALEALSVKLEYDSQPPTTSGKSESDDFGCGSNAEWRQEEKRKLKVEKEATKQQKKERFDEQRGKGAKKKKKKARKQQGTDSSKKSKESEPSFSGTGSHFKSQEYIESGDDSGD